MRAGVECIAGRGVFELAERHGLAGSSRLALYGLGTHQAEDARHLALAVGTVQHRAVLDLAREHPRHRQLAAMCGLHGAQHLRRRFAVIGQPEPLARRLDARRFVPECLQQPPHAKAVFGRADEDRTDLAGAQFAHQIGEH